MTPIFDLDGTLTDPFDGITRSFKHAIETNGFVSPEPHELARWIGPPLRLTFRTVLETDDVEIEERCVASYRERYFDVGYLENAVYPGIEEALETMRASGLRMFVVTSKLQPLARKILEHFGLDRYFDGIFGAEAGGRFDDKAELLREVILVEQLDPSQAVMIGDTRFDMIAARTCGIAGLGVTYGYGSRDELLEHGAVDLCDSPEDLLPRLVELDRNEGRSSRYTRH